MSLRVHSYLTRVPLGTGDGIYCCVPHFITAAHHLPPYMQIHMLLHNTAIIYNTDTDTKLTPLLPISNIWPPYIPLTFQGMRHRGQWSTGNPYSRSIQERYQGFPFETKYLTRHIFCIGGA